MGNNMGYMIQFLSIAHNERFFFQVKRRRRTPQQSDGASEAPPHESGTK
jgi:hypothetical protein